MGKGTGVLFSIMKRATGVDLLRDLSDFFNAFGGMTDGFSRARPARGGAARRQPHHVPAGDLAARGVDPEAEWFRQARCARRTCPSAG